MLKCHLFKREVRKQKNLLCGISAKHKCKGEADRIERSLDKQFDKRKKVTDA